ncbi:MAG: RNA-binding protein [Bdellovibrionales bacterium]|nr:RNA-binding protein [Bdellovibrionales bacterium]
MKKLYIGNLNYETTEDDLRSVFEQFGPIESLKIITDKMSGNSKGFGFVELTDDNLALQAIEALNDQELNGRNMRVNEARPQDSRGPRGGGGGGGRGGRYGGRGNGGGRHGGGGGGRHGGGNRRHGGGNRDGNQW